MVGRERAGVWGGRRVGLGDWRWKEKEVFMRIHVPYRRGEGGGREKVGQGKGGGRGTSPLLGLAVGGGDRC